MTRPYVPSVNPQKYRKRPVVIDAMRWDGSEASQARIVTWANGRIEGFFGEVDEDCEVGYFLAIYTLEGTMKARPGDWVIRGVAGEFYSCKPDIFAATYEAVT